MKHLLIASLCALILQGCKPAEPEASAAPTPESNSPAPTAQAPTGGGGGVAPMAGGAAAGMTPMSGTDSVQGAGAGSTSMAAKGWAKDKLNNTPSSSASQMPSEDGN